MRFILLFVCLLAPALANADKVFLACEGLTHHNLPANQVLELSAQLTISVADGRVETSTTGPSPISEKTETTLTWIASRGNGKFELDIISGRLTRSLFAKSASGEPFLAFQETYQCQRKKKTLLD